MSRPKGSKNLNGKVEIKKLEVEEPKVVPIIQPIEKRVEITSITYESPAQESTVFIKADELAPTEGESVEHKRVREVYIGFRSQNPQGWERDKVELLNKLSKL